MDKKAIFEIIVGNTLEVLPELEEQPIQLDDSLKQLGANSIDRSEILMMTLEAMTLNIPLVEMARAKNIAELVEILYAKQQ